MRRRLNFAIVAGVIAATAVASRPMRRRLNFAIVAGVIAATAVAFAIAGEGLARPSPITRTITRTT